MTREQELFWQEVKKIQDYARSAYAKVSQKKMRKAQRQTRNRKRDAFCGRCFNILYK